MYEHKTVLVTGGASGIGAAIAREFADRRANVYSFDVQAPATPNDGVEYRTVDICDEYTLETALAMIPFSIDFLIHSAGIRGEDTPEGANLMSRINVGGTGRLLEAATSKLVEGAKIIHIASDLALKDPATMSAYAKSKFEAYAVVKKFAAEYPAFDVKVAFPGPIDTPLFRKGKDLARIARINPRSTTYLAQKIIELLESDKKELICLNDEGIWTHFVR